LRPSKHKSPAATRTTARSESARSWLATASILKVEVFGVKKRPSSASSSSRLFFFSGETTTTTTRDPFKERRGTRLSADGDGGDGVAGWYASRFRDYPLAPGGGGRGGEDLHARHLGGILTTKTTPFEVAFVSLAIRATAAAEVPFKSASRRARSFSRTQSRPPQRAGGRRRPEGRCGFGERKKSLFAHLEA